MVQEAVRHALVGDGKGLIMGIADTGELTGNTWI